MTCKSIGCNGTRTDGQDFCPECLIRSTPSASKATDESLSTKYPAYYRDTGGITELDVYAVHHLFDLYDPSGCIHHASKKLLLMGSRNSGKPGYQDVLEARDSLTRWLQLNNTQ